MPTQIVSRGYCLTHNVRKSKNSSYRNMPNQIVSRGYSLTHVTSFSLYRSIPTQIVSRGYCLTHDFRERKILLIVTCLPKLFLVGTV
jgi:hypothetical protein